MTLKLDAQKTAFVLIDLQKGILGQALKPHDATKIVQNTVSLGQAIKKSGGIIVAVNVAFAESLADRPPQLVDAPSPLGEMSAEWSEFVPEIVALNADVHVTKKQWGAFFGTELDLQLRRRGITTIVLSGVSTNFGVESTAREAWQHNYAVILAEDACSSMADEMHQFSITKIMPRISRVRKTSEIIGALT